MRTVTLAIIITAISAVLIGTGAYLWFHHTWLLSAHYNLRIATPPLADAGQKLSTVFSRDVAANYRFIRIDRVQVPNLSESAKALTEKKVDLAVVRSDDEVTLEGRSIFILRKVALAVLVPPKSNVEHLQDLRGQKIGVVSPAQTDDPFIGKIAGFYGLSTNNFIPLEAQESGISLKERRVSAVMVLGPVGAGPISEAFSNIRKAYKAAPAIIDIGEGEAIARRFPAYEAVEIPQGTFGGTPPEPSDAINTVAFSIRLLSRPSLPDRVAAEITRLLLQSKRELISTVPAAAQMEAPDADKTAVLPVHPGTQAYLNGEEPSLLDATLSFYWYAGMFLAVLGPAIGWLVALVGRHRETEVRAKLIRMLELFRIARNGTHDEAGRADIELHDLLEWFFHQMVKGDLKKDEFQCIERMISQVRATIERRGQDKRPSPLRLA